MEESAYSVSMPFASLLPIFTFFLIGFGLRKAGLARAEQADLLFRIVFYVTLPALAFLAVADATLTRQSLYLPVSGFCINLICISAAMLYARSRKLADPQAGALALGAGITNMVFIFPFVLAMLGEMALVDAILFDIGNGVFVATVAYLVSLYYKHEQSVHVLASLSKLLRSPLFIAILVALFVNLRGLPVAEIVVNVLSPLSSATIPITLIALGISFSKVSLDNPLPVVTVVLRMVLGLLVGLVLVWLFGFKGMTAVVVIASAAAPIGFSAVTLASVSELDKEQASIALSISIAVGLLSTALLLSVAARFFDAAFG